MHLDERVALIVVVLVVAANAGASCGAGCAAASHRTSSCTAGTTASCTAGGLWRAGRAHVQAEQGAARAALRSQRVQGANELASVRGLRRCKRRVRRCVLQTRSLQLPRWAVLDRKHHRKSARSKETQVAKIFDSFTLSGTILTLGAWITADIAT